MDDRTQSLTWYLPARDALHVAELALSAGKYAVAAFLCHHAVSLAVLGSLRQRRKNRPGRMPEDVKRLVDEYLHRRPVDPQMLMPQLRAVAAAWGHDPAVVAKLATRDNACRWVREGQEFLTWLAA